jgi:hypothetical protein
MHESTESVEPAHNSRQRRAEFFTSQYRTVLSRGLLQLTEEVRALGGEMASLGNGMALAYGRLTGIVRMTASRSAFGGVEKRIVAMMPEEKSTMENFINEDCRVVDILMGGDIEEQIISFDSSKTALELREIFARFQQQTPLTGP